MQLTSSGESGLKILRKTETRFMSIQEEKYVAARSLNYFGLRSFKMATQTNFTGYEDWCDIIEQRCVCQFRKRLLKVHKD
jgi:hypothetical protein